MLEILLTKIAIQRVKYETQELSFISDQKDLLRNLTCLYDELTDLAIESRKDWTLRFERSELTAVSARIAYADLKTPNEYTIKMKLKSTEKLIDSLRSTLSKATNT